MISNQNRERYQRQILLQEFGETGQQKLLKAKVLVAGAGGLGCPALQYLVAAGTGHIGIIDFDSVELSNLHRQVLYTTEDLGKNKAEVAASRLRMLNPSIHIEPFGFKLDPSNALDVIQNFDLVIDGTDNFPARYLINDACVLLGKTLIYGSVMRFEGQVGVFNCSGQNNEKALNYRHLFPAPPDPEQVPDCANAGVLGVLPGLIGTLQATETIKLITGIGEPLCNHILTYNALNNTFYALELSEAYLPPGSFPADKKELVNFDYEGFCSSNFQVPEISSEEFDALRLLSDTLVLDVREAKEQPQITEFNPLHIPMSELEKRLTEIIPRTRILVFCQTGQRSTKAVKLIQRHFPASSVQSLKGGILNWKKQVLNNK